MKKNWILGLVIVALAALVISIAVPVFAHNPNTRNGATTDTTTNVETQPNSWNRTSPVALRIMTAGGKRWKSTAKTLWAVISAA